MKASSLGEWVNPDVLVQLDALRLKFKKGEPFPHVVVKNFLQEKQAVALFEALKKEKFTHKESDLFSLNQTVDLHASKNEVLKRFHSCAASEEFADLMSQITGLRVDAGALDLAGSLYRGGDYLLCHDDQVEDRKIAYILYLSKSFLQKDGARLVLFNNKNGKPTTEAAAFVPEWNSLMAFEVSKISFHSVEENMSGKDRYAIGGWLH